jgi:protein dithiol oxidoreductase (disulfide-forming)
MRALTIAGLVWLMGSLALVQAQETARYQEGTHYVALPAPAPTEEPDKIEVAELFWYGCGHCYSFEPLIRDWKKTLPEDVHFREVPAMFGGAWNLHGQLFYTLQALDKLDVAHQVVFDAMHKEGKRLGSEEEMISLLEPHGISGDDFRKTWKSFGVRRQIDEAGRLARSYRATGVPTLIVNGKYRIEGGMAGSLEDMLKVAEYLVEQERQQM